MEPDQGDQNDEARSAIVHRETYASHVPSSALNMQLLMTTCPPTCSALMLGLELRLSGLEVLCVRSR